MNDSNSSSIPHPSSSVSQTSSEEDKSSRVSDTVDKSISSKIMIGDPKQNSSDDDRKESFSSIISTSEHLDSGRIEPTPSLNNMLDNQNEPLKTSSEEVAVNIGSGTSPSPTIVSDLSKNDEQILKQQQHLQQSKEDFIEKISTHVQAYINECFEMDQISENPVDRSPSAPAEQTPKITNENPTESIVSEPNVEIIPMEEMNEADSNNNNNHNESIISASTADSNTSNNKSMILPSIRITNEYGQHTESHNHPHPEAIAKNSLESQHSQSPKKKIAVIVKNVSFSYSKKTKVLANINLVVPKAKIFALLGASGCGKTTLLKLILGRLEPKTGSVSVFGSRPGSKNSDIPGSGVGFMPQELALFSTFTFEETLYYFGLLHRIPKDEIAKRTDFLIELLNLPPKTKRIEHCSGGQQRRASIALTLFHSPPLLILDEPTVGVDPLLRLKIWQYLEFLCQNNRMTIIITTHYIEESRAASYLAFMRFGRILTQDTPENLLNKYQKTVLEDVYLILCQNDCGEIKQHYSIKKKRANHSMDGAQKQHQQQQQNDEFEDPYDIKMIDNDVDVGGDQLNTEDEHQSLDKYRNFKIDAIRMKALFFKQITSIKRNPLLFFFFLILPIVQLILFGVSVYKSPENISISIYNADTKALSKRFLEQLDEDLLNVKSYQTLDVAIQSVIDGKSTLALEMGKNFSTAYRRRAKNPSDLSEIDFENSKIKLYLDTTDNFIYRIADGSLKLSFQSFVERVASSFGYNPSTVQIPMVIKEIVHGTFKYNDHDLLNNLVPGSMVAIIYSIPLLMSSMVIVMERKDQVIERTFVNGATSLEVFITHLISLMLPLVIQTFTLLFLALVVFETYNSGSLIESFIMLYLQGFFGILIGLLISAISKNEIVSLLASLSMVFPVWMMSGVFWPLESISPILQSIFWRIPLSYPIRAINNIFRRGYTYEHQEVMFGYASSGLYIIVLLVINIIVFHITSH
ncbi:coenzyme Q-binding protein COQ10-like protein [Sarcoptes scabiei]|nr:coenzyme Q-binding protein COQ10-like protein [Sarcoptes scabiei]